MSQRLLPNSFLFASLLLFSPSPGTAQVENSILYVHGKYSKEASVWRVAASGTAERLPFELRGGGGWLGRGTIYPVPSPDQHWIAFKQDNNLWLLDVSTGDATQVTRVGKPYDDKYASVLIWITAWSPNSQEILYNVDHGATESVEGDRPVVEVRPADYGFHIYDLSSRSHRAIPLHGEFQAWLPGGDFLVLSDAIKRIDRQLLRVSSDANSTTVVQAQRGSLGQLNVNADGSWAVAFLGQEAGGKIVVGLVKINLATGALTPLPPACPRAECQRPRFSPSGTRISYVRVHGGRDKDHRRHQSLIVDGRPIHSCRSVFLLYHYWINNRTVATVCDNEITIRDVETGEEKGRHKLE